MHPEVKVGHFRYSRWTKKNIFAHEFTCDSLEEAFELTYENWGLSEDDFQSRIHNEYYSYRHQTWRYKEYVVIRIV